MARRAWTALLAGALAASALALPACGGGGGGGGEGAPPAEPGPEEVAPETEQARRFRSRDFKPPLTFTVPAGWTVVEAEPGFVQAFGGENQDRGITFDTSFAKQPVEQVVERLRRVPGLDAEQPRKASVGGASGQVFDAVVKADVEIPGTLYFPPPDAELRAYAVRAGKRTVVIFVDVPHPQGSTFFPQAQRVLKTVELGRG